MRGAAGGGRALRPSLVCRGCLTRQSRRPFALSASRQAQSHSEPPASGLSPLSSRRLISVSGPDAAKYLQGVITSSIVNPTGAPRDRGFYTAFLSAQGRVLHDVFIYPDSLGIGRNATGDQGRGRLGESFLIEVDAAEAERLQKHIRRYKLRARFDVRLLDREEWAVWHAWDESGKSGLLGPHDKAGWGGEDTILLRDPRAPSLGCRVVAPGGMTPAVGVDASTEDAYHIRRYLQGVPEGQDELLHEQALPQESNMDVMGGIDFKKGCYVGQELTIRTKHRGVVRKRILPCVLYGAEQGVPERLATKQWK